MATGDGLLARVHPQGGTLTAQAARAIADAALACGNGLLDGTARGNLQIRGVRQARHAELVTRLEAAGLAEPHGPGPYRLTILSPLAGIDPEERIDAAALGAAIEDAARGIAGLPPKTCIAIDGGGAFPLHGTGADLHLCALDGGRLMLGTGGRSGPRWHGALALDRAVEGVIDLLRHGAQHGDGTRDRLGHELESAIEGLDLEPAAPPPARPEGPRAGLLALRGATALLAALPFGRCTAAQLAQAAAWSERWGDGTLRVSPTRGLLLPVLSAADAGRLVVEAAAQGLVIDPADARLAVQACPGAPACGSGATPAAADAARLAVLRLGHTVHVSGCPKGCAHPAAADLTLVGAGPDRYAVVLRGTSRDAATVHLSLDAIMTRLQNARDLTQAFPEASR
jgi:precorrin-3B synthase